MPTPVIRALGLAWFRAEDYQRIREISDDEMIPSFAEWEEKMLKTLSQLAARSDIIVEKVIVDPDQLLDFARRHHAGKINTKVRSEFAGRITAQKYGTHH